MDSNEKDSIINRVTQNDFKLSKHEIIRGYNAYSRVLQNSVLISTNILKAFISNQSKDTISIESSQSPLFTNNVKVGFIIAKKKIKKAVLRNRIKRLLREAYRLNKYCFKIFSSETDIIFSLTDSGYEHFVKNQRQKSDFVEHEMRNLSDKIKNKFIK